MDDESTAPLEIDDVYAMFWRLLDLQVHRYGSAPTGEILVVLSIMLLDQVNANPTVTELAEITNLPKSSVSRYVSTEMGMGFLEEVIDSRDRRRRLLRPTEQAREEMQWHRQQVRDIARQRRLAISGEGETQDPGADLREILRRLSSSER